MLERDAKLQKRRLEAVNEALQEIQNKKTGIIEIVDFPGLCVTSFSVKMGKVSKNHNEFDSKEDMENWISISSSFKIYIEDPDN